MTDRIFLSPPHIGRIERELVSQAFESKYIAPAGPFLTRFEEAFIRQTDWTYCVALSSGTAALHLAMHLHGIGPGDTVAASTLTFIGSVNPVIYCGAKPVFVDADPDSWNMDPDLLAELLEHCARRGQLPKAVVPTDLYGQCADLDRILDICDNYGIPVIVDAAEALGATYKGRSAGFGADAATFSFNGNKIVTTSSGGMLASESKRFIEKARNLSQQARDPAPHYEHSNLGFNYRMSNILAAIGCAQLQRLNQRIDQKRAIFNKYQKALGKTTGITFMPEARYGRSTRWLTVIQISPQRFGADRETVRKALEKENIEARPVWKPMHLQPFFKGIRCIGGAVAATLFEHGLCLPSGTSMSDADIEKVISTVLSCQRR
jgi:dTDP-4-amino-4,6-dideoxygalactose transaminase